MSSLFVYYVAHAAIIIILRWFHFYFLILVIFSGTFEVNSFKVIVKLPNYIILSMSIFFTILDFELAKMSLASPKYFCLLDP